MIRELPIVPMNRTNRPIQLDVDSKLQFMNNELDSSLKCEKQNFL